MMTLDVVLSLSPEACRAYYEGRAEQVHAWSTDGRRVAFPAVALRRVVTREGAHGIYRLRVSDQGKLLEITRQADLR
ncbi:DUF2835 family protein [Halomonas alkalicola]|uniref:DUF2835 family protein n=1 Tax=Halomonas alkalicola TaxID=1930622 RepID=UPI00265F4E7F|nr:DUF2835 family protein [Halomonas alkalicola]